MCETITGILLTWVLEDILSGKCTSCELFVLEASCSNSMECNTEHLSKFLSLTDGFVFVIITGIILLFSP